MEQEILGYKLRKTPQRTSLQRRVISFSFRHMSAGAVSEVRRLPTRVSPSLQGLALKLVSLILGCSGR